MKKLIVILMLVALAGTPALAAVTISGTSSGTTGTVNYSVTGPNSVRAFALDITLSSGTISGVTCSNASYYIYPGSIAITSGSVSATGTCVCDATKFPGKGQGGVGTAGVSVEMGSLYTGASKPASSGTLLTFTVSATPCTATVGANSARGGVVMENPDESPALSPALPITIPFGSGVCYTGAHATDWAAVESPACWCATGAGSNPRQCHGDANAKEETTKNHYWVSTTDLNVLVAAWNKTYTQIKGLTYSGDGTTKLICADFSQTVETTKNNYRVSTTDLNILITNWNHSNLPLADCP